MTLTPAYGGDYKNRAAIVDDLNKGRDFIMHTYNGSSGYCSKRELPSGEDIQVRNANRRKVWVITIQNGRAK